MAKKAKRRDDDDIIPWAEARGVASFDINEIILLADAPVEKVAQTFRKLKKLKTLVTNAWGKSITVTAPSYLIYRLKGHRWTIVDSYKSGYVEPADAAAMSKALKTKVIYYGNSDTAGATSYDLYDNGRRLEHFECFEGVEFESSVRNIPPPEDGPEIYDFVQDFMRAQDALAPSWSIYFGSMCHKYGDRVKLDAVPRTVIDRVDYVSGEVRPREEDPNVVFEKIVRDVAARTLGDGDDSGEERGAAAAAKPKRSRPASSGGQGTRVRRGRKKGRRTHRR